MTDMPSPTVRASESPPEAGDRCQAWYEAYGRTVYRYVRFQLPSADAAEDVTADTFLKVFRAAHRYDASRGAPRTWIFQIARNTLRDYLRRDRVRRHLSLGAMRDLASDAPSPEERVLWEEEVARLLGLVGELGERDRELISLCYGSGLDHANIAEILGVRAAVVRTRLWRALGRLRARMGDRDG